MYYLQGALSGRRLQKGRGAVSEFDYVHGADTEDICEVGSLDIVFSENARHAKRY
jgi:hypothetical protein